MNVADLFRICANTSSYSKTSRDIDVWFYNSSEAKNCVHDKDDDDGSLYQFDQWSSTGFASDFTWTSKYSIKHVLKHEEQQHKGLFY